MPTFAYQARDGKGQSISGTRDANDQRAALEALREAGLFVLDLKPTKNSAQSTAEVSSNTAAPPRKPIAAAQSTAQAQIPAQAAQSTAGTQNNTKANTVVDYTARANSKQMALFFRQMYAMLHAGTSVSRALDTIASHDASTHLRRAAYAMSQSTARGQSWSESMTLFPGLFSNLMIGMVAAGEKGGFLDRVCVKLADNAERDYEIQQTIKRETWYPKLLIWASIYIPSVVPLVMVGFSAWLRAVTAPTIFLVSLVVLWRVFNYFSPLLGHMRPLRKVIDGIKLKTPIVGKVTRAFATAKFCRALGATYAAGMAPHASMRMAAGACGNTILEENALGVIPLVERGESMASVLTSTGQFPPIALQMLRSGEETGQIDSQLDNVADFLENDAETALKQAVKVFAMLVFLLIAAYIGSQIIASHVGMAEGLMDAMDE